MWARKLTVLLIGMQNAWKQLTMLLVTVMTAGGLVNVPSTARWGPAYHDSFPEMTETPFTYDPDRRVRCVDVSTIRIRLP